MCCPAARIFFALSLAGTALYLAGDSPDRSFPVEAGRSYAVSVSAPTLAPLQKGTRVEVTVTDPSGSSLAKTLHAGDPDLYLTIKPQQSGKLGVKIAGDPIEIAANVTEIPGAASKDAQIASAFHTTWQTAEPIDLGRAVYATADDRPYIPSLGGAKETFAQMVAGVHWYKLDYKGPGDRLVHFNVDVLDRDVPADVAVFTIDNGSPVEYTRGRERYEPERSTNFHGLFKFQPRVISPGAYYVRVMANHPFYKLETDHYAPPPYTDPRLAVRAAMDYVVRKGDAWHANIPREGGIALRNTNNLQETRLCIACHPTQFSMRGEMFALENGYPVRARSSVQFLAERLYNNPRPIYGKTGASWARMIHAPGNVLSRVAWLANKYDTLITGERREELYRGVSAYLEMYWPGMTEPSHESNGNLPRISGFEVAMHNAMLFGDLHKRSGEAKYAALREQIEHVIVNGKPDDVLDLCWKIDALVWLGRDRYAAEIKKLSGELLSHQQADGRWALPFGLEEVQYDFARQRKTVKKIPVRAGMAGPPAADFQTWHAIYALARAGFTLDDPRLKKAFDLELARQTPSGAWQGNPDYKNFDTPFRDTQYALMAISTLFPGEKGRGGVKGWNAGFAPPPASFDEKDTAGTLAALDRHWDRPAPAMVAKIRKLLDSPQPLVRYQAAVTLGRFADLDSAAALAAKLGDRAKMVQRAAAWSLRQIGSRRGDTAAIEKALASPDDRARWGAARVFNQHFKYLTSSWSLADKLRTMAASDPVPSIKMAATQALYQWWFWDPAPDHRTAVEDTLIAGLGREEHPWVRRNFMEAYLGVLDDNVRYLYGSWIPRIKRPEDRKAIEEGHKATVLAQATRFRDAARTGNSLLRDGLLRTLYTHHVREGLPDVSALAATPVPATLTGTWINGYKFSAMYDPLAGGTAAFSRIGNDAEPPVFYKDSSPLINEAILATLGDPSPAVILSAMRALKGLRSLSVEPVLANRVLSLLGDAPLSVRADVADVVKTLLKWADFEQPRIDALAANGDPLTLDALSSLARQPPAGVVRTRLLATKYDDRAFPALVALSGALAGDEAVTVHVLGALSNRRPQPQRAALRFALSHPDRVKIPDEFPEKFGPYAVGSALSVVADFDYSNGQRAAAIPAVRRILLAGFANQVHTIRTQALTALRSIEPLHRDAEILGWIGKLKRDPDKNVRASAVSFETSQLARSNGAGAKTEDLLDYFFFKENVEPILLAKGSDGQACVQCHANHTILKLNEADEFGVVTLAKSRANYNSVTKMVNVDNPDQSLLLNKPLAPLDDAGIGDSQAFTHGGGLRWSGHRDSPQYRTILRWIQGARL